MTDKPDAKAEALEKLEPVEAFLAKIRVLLPGADETNEAVEALAVLYRQRAYHGLRLEADPADSYSSDQYLKLATAIARAENDLGISNRPDAGNVPPPLGGIRRS